MQALVDIQRTFQEDLPAGSPITHLNEHAPAKALPGVDYLVGGYLAKLSRACLD